jgi:cytochrome bd ubiquinol oxidase subunit II
MELDPVVLARAQLIWAGIIGVAVALYVVLDGFDLGIGMLFPFAKDDAERDRMLAAIAPFWDGNETWLVLGGGGLLVAFPRAYAIIMPAFYLPIIVMLLALVFRGVTFEFRSIAHRKPIWNAVFAMGSTLAGFCQGLILGGLVQGVRSKAAALPAARSTGRRHSGRCAESTSLPATRSSAPLG